MWQIFIPCQRSYTICQSYILFAKSRHINFENDTDYFEMCYFLQCVSMRYCKMILKYSAILRRVSIIAVFATYQSTILHINARQCSFLHLHINIAVSSLPWHIMFYIHVTKFSMPRSPEHFPLHYQTKGTYEICV